MAKKTDDIEIRNGTAQDESNAADSEKMIDTKDEAAAEQPESMTEQLLRRMDEIAAENEKIREELSRTRKESAETREKAEKAAELTEGQKQALMERNFHEAMERAKMDKVTITIPADPNGEDDDIFVSVNGYRYLIRRGEAVEVPRFVAEALKNSDRQKLEANRHMKKIQK